MILADTSVWADFLATSDAGFARLLNAERIVGHPLVIAEIALGSLRSRTATLAALDRIATAPVADVDEVRELIERRALFSRGIGYVDTALLASCLLAPPMRLWTRDRRLAKVAVDLGIGWRGEA